MYFWTNLRCRIEDCVEEAAVIPLPLNIIRLKIVPRVLILAKGIIVEEPVLIKYIFFQMNCSMTNEIQNKSCCSECLGLGPDKYNQLYAIYSFT